jgi:cytochrome c-type biogenesis protein CcmF
MTMPLGLAMLTLMAIAPVLPWRKASAELLSERLWWPAWAGAAAIVVALVLGASGWAPVAAFGLGGFAAGAAVRQLVLATRRQGWRGLLGRTNGGMIVHLGVIVIAVAFAAAQAYESSGEFELKPGQSATFDGHRVTYEGSTLVTGEQVSALRARVLVDGEPREPEIQTFRASGASGVLKPSVKPGIGRNVYVTLEQPPGADDTAVIKVLVTPLVSWLWVGGGIMVAGTALAAFPGRRRRRPTAPVSQAVPEAPHEPREVVPA